MAAKWMRYDMYLLLMIPVAGAIAAFTQNGFVVLALAMLMLLVAPKVTR